MLQRFAILLLFILVSQPALAERKAALLIGNAAYSTPATALRNPPNDIAGMKAMLEGAGFDVTVLQDGGRAAMSEALGSFEAKVTGADIGLIYYSGHGIELDGTNFLIPVDAKLTSDREVKYETIVLDDLMQALAGVTRLKLVLLDACRDNPFLASMKRLSTRGIPTRGLGRVDSAESNMLIGFATAPGAVALDGDGDMSPYAAALTRHLVTPGLEIEAALRAVAKDVFDATGGKQRPFKTGSLFETVLLGKAIAPPASAVVGQSDPCRDAAAHWAEIRESGSGPMFEDHIRLFPTCAFANLARQRIGGLAPEPALIATTEETECDRLTSTANDPFALASVKPVAFDFIDVSKAVPACEEAIRKAPSEKRFPFQFGRALEKAGRLEEALTQYRKAAAHGNAAAMTNVGWAHETGRGTDQSDEAAMEWYRKAAAGNEAQAMANIGLFYEQGRAVKQDHTEAMRWYRQAAHLGNAGAMTNIGWAYEAAVGVEQNDQEALTWYRKAAEAGDAMAMNNIGVFYAEGRAVKKDLGEALDWYRKAAENGNGFGAHSLALALDEEGPNADPLEAARWMEVALRLGHAEALRQMKDDKRAWSIAFRKELQRRLVAAGVYSGKLDGQMGPSTTGALEAIFGKTGA